MKQILYSGQAVALVVTIKDPDGALVDLTGHTATVVLVKPDLSSVTKTGAVDTVASTVTVALTASDLDIGDTGYWNYQAVVASGGDDWPASVHHFHLVARLS